jgi:hypothetical protein
MLLLNTGDTLRGDADAASQVTVTVFGMEKNGPTETYQVLYQGQLPVTVGTLYTVPASTQTFVRSISIVNNDTSKRTFELLVNGTAAANRITPVSDVIAGGLVTYEDGQGWKAYNKAMSTLEGANNFVSPESTFGPSGVYSETIDRIDCPEVNTTVAASGTLFMQMVYLKAGQVVSNISICSATTASATVTGNLVGLYDINRALLATSANNTTAHAANTFRTYAMTTPYTVPSDGQYYIGYFCTATTVATLKGGTAKTGGQLSAVAPIAQGTSTTSLTTSLPATAAALTVTTASIWAGVS